MKKIAAKHTDALKRKIAELEAMVDSLEHLSKHCHGDHRPDCPIIEGFAADQGKLDDIPAQKGKKFDVSRITA